MSPFVETLKRLYMTMKIDITKIEALKAVGKITQEEYDYIITQ